MNNFYLKMTEPPKKIIHLKQKSILQDALILELKPLVPISTIKDIFATPNPNYPNAFIIKKTTVCFVWLINEKIDLRYSNMHQFLECLLEALFISTNISPALFYKPKFQPLDKIKISPSDTVNIFSGKSYSIINLLGAIDGNVKSSPFSFYLKKFWKTYQDYYSFVQLTEKEEPPSKLSIFKKFPELKEEFEKELPSDLLERKEGDENLAFLLNAYGVSTANITYLLTWKALNDGIMFNKDALRQYYISLLEAMGLLEKEENFDFKQVIKAREILKDILGIDIVYVELPSDTKEKIKVVMADGTYIPVTSLKEFTVASTYTTLMVGYKKENFESIKSHRVKNNMQILMGAINALLVRPKTSIFDNDLILYLQEYINHRTTYCYPLSGKVLKKALPSITTPVVISNILYPLITNTSDETRKKEIKNRKAFIAREAFIAINLIDILRYLRENYSKIVPLNEIKRTILSLPGTFEQTKVGKHTLKFPGIIFIHSYSLNLTNILFKDNGTIENLIPGDE